MIEFFLILTMCADPTMNTDCKAHRISAALTEDQCKQKAVVTAQVLGAGPRSNYRLRCDRDPAAL